MAGLPTFTFVPFFSAKKQACGPEGRALRVKSIGGKRKPSEDLIVLPQSQAGPSGVPNSEFGMWNSEFLGSFLPFRIPHSTFRISIARPIREMKSASWFLRVTPLLSGRATPENQEGYTCLLNSEGQ